MVLENARPPSSSRVAAAGFLALVLSLILASLVAFAEDPGLSADDGGLAVDDGGLAVDDGALPGLDGDQLTAADFEDETLILVVWASWSPRCRDIAARVDPLADRFAVRARVATVVFQEEEAAVRRFLASQSLRTAVYLDQTGAFSKEHAVTTLPGLLIFQDGVLKLSGKLPDDPDPLIERALSRE